MNLPLSSLLAVTLPLSALAAPDPLFVCIPEISLAASQSDIAAALVTASESPDVLACLTAQNALATLQFSDKQTDDPQQLSCISDKIAISDVRLETIDNGYFSDKLEIYMTFTNSLSWPIAMIAFDYGLYSEGRSIPWGEGRSAAVFPGGLEGGETREASALIDYPVEGDPHTLFPQLEISIVRGPNKESVGRDFLQTNPSLPCD